MKSRHVVRERTVGRGAAGLVLALLLAPFLALISSGTASAVDTLCLPGPDERLHRRHHPDRGRSAPRDVKLTVTDEAGNVTEVTTGETGKWNFEVDRDGTYVVKVDEESLPKDLDVDDRSRSTVQAKFGVTQAGAAHDPHRRPTATRPASSTSCSRARSTACASACCSRSPRSASR